jgi:citronellyl-CoA dehydrogenase
VRVPRRHLIGQEGMGFTFQMLQFQEERLWGAAGTLRSLDRLIDQTIEYTRQRKAFGKSILDNQVVHYRLAELRTEVEALRALTYRAVEMYVGGKDVTKLATHGQAEVRPAVARGDRQLPAVLGRHGLHLGQPDVAGLPRFSRLISIGGGADEVMLGIICKLEGTLPGKA